MEGVDLRRSWRMTLEQNVYTMKPLLFAELDQCPHISRMCTALAVQPPPQVGGPSDDFLILNVPEPKNVCYSELGHLSLRVYALYCVPANKNYGVSTTTVQRVLRDNMTPIIK